MYFHTGQCPTVLIQLSGKVKTQIGEYAGEYTLRVGETTNSKEDWISADGQSAIWYYNEWKVGLVSDRGTGTSDMTMTNSQISPGDTGNKWIYHNGDTWITEPGDDVQVMCKGT